MPTRHRVWLQLNDSTFQPALLRDLARHDGKWMDAHWWANLNAPSSLKRLEPDRPWKWRKLIGQTFKDQFAFAVGIETPDHHIQGAMIYRFDGGSLVANKPACLGVDYLATAPWNRALVPEPFFSGIGKALIAFAVTESFQFGFQGRVFLYAVQQAVPFYQKIGLDCVGEGSTNSLAECTLHSSEARAFRSQEGWRVR